MVGSMSTEQGSGKTVIVKNQKGDLPFPWSEKDPYKLPVSIDRVQKLLLASGEKAEVNSRQPVHGLNLQRLACRLGEAVGGANHRSHHEGHASHDGGARPGSGQFAACMHLCTKVSRQWSVCSMHPCARH